MTNRDVRSGRGDVRGRRHPYIPLIPVVRWTADREWRRSAGRERGRRTASLWLNARYVVLVVCSLGAGVLAVRADLHPIIPTVLWIIAGWLVGTALS